MYLHSKEAVQQFKIGRKRRGNRALNPKRRGKIVRQPSRLKSHDSSQKTFS
jgi:hypothetical protein